MTTLCLVHLSQPHPRRSTEGNTDQPHQYTYSMLANTETEINSQLVCTHTLLHQLQRDKVYYVFYLVTSASTLTNYTITKALVKLGNAKMVKEPSPRAMVVTEARRPMMTEKGIDIASALVPSLLT